MKFAALTTNDYAIIVQDLNGVIMSWNRARGACSVTTKPRLIGKPIDLIFSAEDREQGVPLAERQQARTAGRTDDERWHVRKDGRRIYLQWRRDRNRHRRVQGLRKIARDLTDRKVAESRQADRLELERRVRARAIAANRQKDQFFAVLSHELKNPLNLIHVKAEMLTRAPGLGTSRWFRTPPM